MRRRSADVAEVRLTGTDELLVVTSEYRRARDQSAYTWFLRVVASGRRRKELGRVGIRSWTGEFDAVIPAPDGRVAAVRWNDQTEAGLVLVELVPELRQLDAAWDTRETNWLEGPVWTDDARLLVLVENPSGAGPWWAEREPGEADDDDYSPGGTFTPGSVVVLDRDLVERARLRVDVELTAGWFPAGDHDRGLGQPRLGEGCVLVRVPEQGELRLRLPALH